MGFFRDFRDEFAQATKEMIPAKEEVEVKEVAHVEEPEKKEESILGEDLSMLGIPFVEEDNPELSKLNSLLNQVEAATMLAYNRDTDLYPRKGAGKVGNGDMMNQAIDQRVALEETSVITTSAVFNGDIQSLGSINIQGTLNGNVSCYGKLVVTGTIIGNNNSSEFFANAAHVEGEIVSSGTVKVGAGSVIVGNITASSAVIAGAIKGDIDVQGPVVIDTSAVIKGNIKSRSVQINNGAIIQGFCSQCYAEVDVEGVFDQNEEEEIAEIEEAAVIEETVDVEETVDTEDTVKKTVTNKGVR